MESNTIIILLLIILIILFIWDLSTRENFYINQNSSNLNSPNLYYPQYQGLNYNTRVNNCDELTFHKYPCKVETVIPKNKKVCNDQLIPIDNNNLKVYKKKLNNTINSKPKPIANIDLGSLMSDSINNRENETDIKSLNSLDQDLISN